MAVQNPAPRFRVGADFEAAYPGASALATECVLNMGFVCHRFTAYVEGLARRHGIPSVAAFNVLTILGGAEQPLPPSVVAERMVVTRGTITSVVDSLECRGLVRRLPHGKDRRVRLIDITPEGSARAARVEVVLHGAEKRLLDRLTQAQQRQLLRMLAALQASLPTD